MQDDHICKALFDLLLYKGTTRFDYITLGWFFKATILHIYLGERLTLIMGHF